jgi:hypothetical protein
MVKKTTKKIPLDIRAQDVALELASSQDWGTLTMDEIAATAGVDSDELLQIYSSKSAIIRGFMDRMDTLIPATPEGNAANEPVRDRLFDIIMNRLDALVPYRQGLMSVARSGARDPANGLCLLLRHRRSLGLMLNGAGLPSTGLRGQLLLKGLALVYANAVRIWINDNTDDLGKTMAAVDQGLEMAGKIANRCFCSNQPSSTANLTI